MAFDVAKIQDRIDLATASNVEVSDSVGGIRFQNMLEVLEFSKMMAVAETAVPKHLRGNPGMCLAVCVQALEWRFSPFAVANKSYVVNDRIGYESQLVHAVVEQRAPIVGRLKHRFDGENGERRCIVSATLRETGETIEYISPPFDKIQPKNSPLWKTKPDLQLYYNTSRDFCRAYFPDVLLGVYAEDELRDHVGPDHAKDVSDKPGIASRLKGSRGRGFSSAHVERETGHSVIDESASHQQTEAQREAEGKAPPPASTGDEPLASAQGPLSNGSEGAQDRCESAPSPSSEESSSVVAGTPAHDETERPGESGNHASGDSAGVPSLPDGWARQYVNALNRAQAKTSLKKFAAQYWEQFGGFDQYKGTPDGHTAAEIYSAFMNHFGDAGREDREAILHELGAE